MHVIDPFHILGVTHMPTLPISDLFDGDRRCIILYYYTDINNPKIENIPNIKTSLIFIYSPIQISKKQIYLYWQILKDILFQF